MFGIENLFKKDAKQSSKQNSKPTNKRGTFKAYLAGENNGQQMVRWTNYKHTSDEIILKYFQTLVARSCEQCMNNPYAKKFLFMLKNNVIGPNGSKLAALAKDTPDKLDTVANKAIELAWNTWAKNCDVTGKLDFVQMQKLMIDTIAREGEVLIKFVKGKDAGPWGFALQLIDPRRLDFYKNEFNTNANQNYIRFGVEYNQYGKPLNYYIVQDYSDFYYHTGDKYAIIPSEQILHPFVSEYIDQKRGLPWFSNVLMRMNMLAGFEEAAVEHARAGACQMAFLKNNDPEAYSDDSEEDPGSLDFEMEAAGMPVLPAGYDVEPFNPNYPNGEFDSFSKAILRGIASGIGANYNSIANDLSSVNFSSLRQGALDERDNWMCLQKWFESVVLNPIYEEWLKYSLLNKKIVLGNVVLPAEKIDKYRNIAWRHRRWSWVDPIKDVNSAIASISAGLKSRSSVIEDQGLDPEEVWDEIAQENEILRSKDILVKDELIKDVGNEGENSRQN